MVAEGELRSNVDDSDRVKELQDEVAYLKAEVNLKVKSLFIYVWVARRKAF